MPGSNPLPIVLGSYRPAAVFVMDLVKHSVQNNPTSKAVQSVLTETVEAALCALHLSDVHFSHTGDGYVWL
jgi:hypothetical protein